MTINENYASHWTTLALSLLLGAGCGDDTTGDGSDTANSGSGDTMNDESGGPGSTSGMDPTTDPSDGSPEDSGSDEGTTTSMEDSGSQTDEGSSDDTGSTDGTGTTGGDGDGVLGNTPLECRQLSSTFPILPAEAGHLAATVLTPPAYPYQVDSLQYELRGTAGGANCISSLAHHVEVSVIDGVPPPDMPSIDAIDFLSIDVPEDPGAMDDRLVELPLDTPIVLQDGESVMIGVAMVATMDLSASLCMRTCADQGPTPDVDYWSNAAMEPYPWADMVTAFGFSTLFNIHAFGEVL